MTTSKCTLPGALLLSSKIKTVDLLKLISQRLSLAAMWESTFSIQECSWGLWMKFNTDVKHDNLSEVVEFNHPKPQVHGIQEEGEHEIV